VAQGTAAREAAIQILEGVRSGRPFEAAQAAAVDGLSDPDRRLAHQIAAGVLRTRSELDRRIEQLLSGDWKRTPPQLKDLLRIGAYQLTHLNRIPAYAAVQATVEVAKQRRGLRAAKFVNAILRRLSATPVERKNRSPITGVAELARAESHPTWLVERWVERHGFERTAALLKHNNSQPPLVIQPVCWTLERLRNALESSSIRSEDAPGGRGLVVYGARVERLPGFREGAFIVQDPAQARLLEYADIPPGALVWDACAAPGGKTAILSRRGPVVATEMRRDRLPRLRDTLARTTAGVPVAVADARHPPVDPRKVDVVLLDAPCTATGTLARHPDGRWRLSEHGITSMARRQQAILSGAASAVRKQGLMVYLTCSLEPEENGEQVDRFLELNPDFERDSADLFLFPPDTGTDGGYGARLRRLA
jgi:16S rRNA (cytosine967-C5)-methyltransferase